MSSKYVSVIKVPTAATTLDDHLSLKNGNIDGPQSFAHLGGYEESIGGGAYMGKAMVDVGAVSASATITFQLVAAGDTVTVGSTVFTGTNGTPGATGFQTNVTPSAAADIVAAASLSAKINANTTSGPLVVATNTAGTAIVALEVIVPGAIGNFVPVLISAHGIISNPNAAPVNAILASASSYALLAKVAITNSGLTVVNGNFASGGVIGGDTGWTFSTSPSTGIVNGTHHAADSTYTSVYADSTAAEVALQALISGGSPTDITSVDLGGKTYGPGLYTATTQTAWSASTNLTLSGAGTYIFSFGTTFIMPATASILLTNGATADNVYFIAGTAITFGANNNVSGNFMAGSAITTASNTVVTGRLLTYGSSGTSITIPSALSLKSPNPTLGAGAGADGTVYNFAVGL